MHVDRLLCSSWFYFFTFSLLFVVFVSSLVIGKFFLKTTTKKIRFQLDDVVPLTYCVQVSPHRFEEQRKEESKREIHQLLDHIVNDQNMPLKEKRKRLKQVDRHFDIYRIENNELRCFAISSFKLPTQKFIGASFPRKRIYLRKSDINRRVKSGQATSPLCFPGSATYVLHDFNDIMTIVYFFTIFRFLLLI